MGQTHKKISQTTYVFNLDESKPTVVVAIGLDF
jgi:hypothetical protein